MSLISFLNDIGKALLYVNVSVAGELLSTVKKSVLFTSQKSFATFEFRDYKEKTFSLNWWEFVIAGVLQSPITELFFFRQDEFTQRLDNHCTRNGKIPFDKVIGYITYRHFSGWLVCKIDLEFKSRSFFTH